MMREHSSSKEGDSEDENSGAENTYACSGS